ncbi:hypothetical protein GLYMA_14G163100v4 [Glycine max]|uniref:Uncharacterized protein n=1 Tax=Glycine max TaxID=3847 RepID=A0A0R0GDW6_SOYBN|nr:hypothetical protein GLYMA_14G163100v4 [Glycine max]KRH16577.1 hypothetical protein GLYMA_14G163100v4 [Glycine max]
MCSYFVAASCVFRFQFLLNILLEYAIDHLSAWIGIFLACNVHTNGGNRGLPLLSCEGLVTEVQQVFSRILLSH